MRIDANTYNRLSNDIQDGTRAAEILFTNTQDVTPERLEQLPRSMQDAARVLLAGSKTLEAVKEKSKRHEQELKKIEKEAREEKRRQIDEDVENIAALRAEEIAKPYAEHLARKMTAKAAKNIELSEGMKARIKLIGWKNDFEESTSLQRDRIWGDRFLEKQKQFTKEETERIEEENKAIWDEYAKQWLEQAEAEKKQEMQRLKEDYVAGEKRKRDETEAELWDQCGTGSESDSPDSDGEESDDGGSDNGGSDNGGSDNGGSDHGGGNDAGNGPGKPPKHPGPGPGPGGSEVNRDNTLSKAPPLSSGKSGQGGTGGPPTGPRKITDDRDKNPHGSGSRNPPSNTHNQDRKPSSGSGTTPASNGSKPNPFENAERRPPGGWSEENEKRKPLSDNPFEEAQARML
ncbi:hypothetical protein E2P81_ATG01728 [Venturia nashicola]|nr:hypothetical protein E2P81_ATG01728 [Venturia nashicola]